MIRPRYALAATLCGAVGVLTSCATTTAGHGAPAALAGAQSQSGAAASTPANGPVLAALLTKNLDQTTSLHLDMSINAAGQKITGSGDETFADGKVTAVDLTEKVPTAGSIQIVVIGTQVYAKLPAALSAANPSQPWVMADANSSDPIARALGTSAGSVLSQSSLSSYSDLAAAAVTVTSKGSDSVNGTPATHYSIMVDLTKLPVDSQAAQSLSAAGLSTLPADLWLDSQGRLLRFTEKVTVSGQTVSTEVTISKYNQPVTISAPPADQIAH